MRDLENKNKKVGENKRGEKGAKLRPQLRRRGIKGGPADPSTEVSYGGRSGFGRGVKGEGRPALYPHIPHVAPTDLRRLFPVPSSSAPLPRFRSFSSSPSLSLTCWPWCSSPVGATACRGRASQTGSGAGELQTR